jgi:hypothetical protein
MQFYVMKLRELAKIVGPCGKMRELVKNAAFR